MCPSVANENVLLPSVVLTSRDSRFFLVHLLASSSNIQNHQIVKMLPSCNKLLFFLLWMTTYGNTLTISSTVNSTDLDSGTSTGLVINSSCKTTHQCSGKLVCFNGQCQCCENHIWNGTNCILEKTFKSLCEHNTECDTTLFCIYGTCQCAQMHYWNGNICVSKKISNETCTNSYECGGKLLCENGECQCPIDLFWNGNKCIVEKFDGDLCSSSIECADNMECRDSICQCPESEYWENPKCTSKKSLNDACMKEGECGTTLYCARNVCQCASSDYWAGSTCAIKKDENATCNSSLECKVTLQCKRNHCVCCEEDFWNGQLCEKKVCVIEKCLNGGRCQISKRIAQCVCAEGYLGDRCQYAVPLNSINKQYILDSNVLMTNGLHQAGAEIHSNVPINLYGFLFKRRDYSEGFLVLPTRFASTNYIIPSFTVSTVSSICQSIFALSPVYSSAVIEINFKIKEGSVSYETIQYSYNQTLTLVLNKYTTFQIWHTSDFTGTIVIASQPIVVVSETDATILFIKKAAVSRLLKWYYLQIN
ncbi:unnamed protein product [Mytilus edulis]|uniref:EGF-like domain-containing protein n=1 Tax=Mytilus edulis TaxID=6550 RepID=A0A8S3PRE0_MYTED|nr:unnamed protein product [Mytilus edulis]